MKKHLREAEYGLTCKVGPATDTMKAKELVKQLRDMGLYSNIENGYVVIEVERNPLDDNYVDDMVQIAKKEYEKIMGNNDSVERTYRMAESKLRKMIKESVKKVLKEEVSDADMRAFERERQWREEVIAERKFIEEVITYLKRNGIKTAHMNNTPSGWPCVSLDVDEHYNSNAKQLAEMFAKRNNRDFRYDTYPATAYYTFD